MDVFVWVLSFFLKSILHNKAYLNWRSTGWSVILWVMTISHYWVVSVVAGIDLFTFVFQGFEDKYSDHVYQPLISSELHDPNVAPI